MDQFPFYYSQDVYPQDTSQQQQPTYSLHSQLQSALQPPHPLLQPPPHQVYQELPAYPPLQHPQNTTSGNRLSHSPSSMALYHPDLSPPALSQAPDAQYSSSSRLPRVAQVEKQEVATTAAQAASSSRRRSEANFVCPVPGCGSTFTRRFNLKGHLRSHTSERPYICQWPGCGRGFVRKHDCKRHYQLHAKKAGAHICQSCGRSFSRMDALNRHLRSDSGAECRVQPRPANPGEAGPSSVTMSSGSLGETTSMMRQ